jgi:hypothetical protein
VFLLVPVGEGAFELVSERFDVGGDDDEDSGVFGDFGAFRAEEEGRAEDGEHGGADEDAGDLHGVTLRERRRV